MKKLLLALNTAYFLFGATIYAGVMWALKFFWYPSWGGLTLTTVGGNFVSPTSHATQFFLIVVPLMLLSGIAMIINEWKTKQIWAVVIAYLGLLGATYVGWLHIIPVNKTIAAGVADQAALSQLLEKWMFLNTIRWYITTIMWGATVFYIFQKGNIYGLFNKKSQA